MRTLWNLHGLKQWQCRLSFGEKLATAAADQHHFFESDEAAMMDVLDSQLDGEDASRFRHPVGQPAIPFPPRPRTPPPSCTAQPTWCPVASWYSG